MSISKYVYSFPNCIGITDCDRTGPCLCLYLVKTLFGKQNCELRIDTYRNTSRLKLAEKKSQ